jgi:hypothetical protein
MSWGQVSNIRWTRCLCAGPLVCGAAAIAVLVGVDRSRADGVAHRSALGLPKAHAAKIETADEIVVLRVTKIANTTIAAEGQSPKPPLLGNVKLTLTLLNASHGRMNFTGGNSSGKVQGLGFSNYHVSGATSSFKGAISTMTGTGKYEHYKNLGMTFSGTLNRRTYKVSVTVLGKWSTG